MINRANLNTPSVSISKDTLLITQVVDSDSQSVSDSFAREDSGLGHLAKSPDPLMDMPFGTSNVEKRVFYERVGQWTPLEVSAMNYPSPASGVRPVVDSIPYGQRVSCVIGNETVRGTFEGWDYKQRPKIQTEAGIRIGSWKSLLVEGSPRNVPAGRTFESLTSGSILRPPARLNAALKKALAQRVTGTHTALEYKEALEKEGYPMYVVGGAIRDAIFLLKENPNASDDEIIDLIKDIDIVTTASPAVLRRIAGEIAPEFEGAVFSPDIVDQFGCVLVGGPKAGLADCAGIDLVSIRKGATGPRPVYHVDTHEKVLDTTLGYRLKEDVLGRDFTCNALYYDPLNEVIVDPTGTGVADAQHNILRLVEESGSTLDVDKLFRYYKFKLRGYSSDSFDKALIRKCALDTLTRESESHLIRNITRIAPKEIVGEAEALTYLEDLHQAMNEDGNGDVYKMCIAPLAGEISTNIVKSHQTPETDSHDWTHLLIGAGIGISGWLAATYLKDDLKLAIDPMVGPVSKKVEDKVNSYGEAFTAWTGVSLPAFSFGSFI